MNENHPESPVGADSETALLLANIDSALRALKNASESGDPRRSLVSLEAALHTYGAVKHLLPKLNLSAAQRLPVETQLQKLRDEIVARS